MLLRILEDSSYTLGFNDKLRPKDLSHQKSESHLQIECFRWLATMFVATEDLRFYLPFSVPNGGERNIKVASTMKAEGVKSGVPDIMIPYAHTSPDNKPRTNYGLFIELKVKSNKPSKEQVSWSQMLDSQGYRCVLINHLDDFKFEILRLFGYEEEPTQSE